MIEPIDSLLRGLCSLVVGILIIVCLVLLIAKGGGSTAGYSDVSDNPNVITGGMAVAANEFGHAAYTTSSGFGSAVHQAGATVGSGTRTVAMTTARGGRAIDRTAVDGTVFAGRSAVLVGHGMIGGASLAGRGLLGGLALDQRFSTDEVTFTARAIGGGFAYTGHTIGHAIDGGFAITGHTAGNVFNSFAGLTHVSSVIQPIDPTPTPVITQMRAQQAAIIQSGTEDVSVASPVTYTTGGACDNGQGNGGYPMIWCNAPMDSVATIGYSSDPINRECTSYASWYFTAVEGHENFRDLGNAKYWARNSNYPTHAAPAVGAIAVETVGAYGHVAIVQALPGQTYAGKVVPAGYVLVSEMNYDWNGHFRYSYSPLSKFSAYIYP